MTFKKFIKLILFNLGIAATNIVVFSKAFFGLSLLTGSALTLGAAWTTILASIGGFYYVNNKLLNQPSTYALIVSVPFIPVVSSLIYPANISAPSSIFPVSCKRYMLSLLFSLAFQ